MARFAYHGLVQEAQRIQQEIVMRKLLVAEFGNDAIPPGSVLPSKVLRDAAETNQRRDVEQRQRLAEIMDTMRDMEARFEKDDEAWATAAAQHFRRSKR